MQMPLLAGLNGELAPNSMALRIKEECNAAMAKAYADFDQLTRGLK